MNWNADVLVDVVVGCKSGDKNNVLDEGVDVGLIKQSAEKGKGAVDDGDDKVEEEEDESGGSRVVVVVIIVLTVLF